MPEFVWNVSKREVHRHQMGQQKFSKPALTLEYES